MSTPSFAGNAFMQRMQAAVQHDRSTVTPGSTARKRRRHELDGSSSAAQSDDEGEDMPPAPLGLGGSGPATRNATMAVKNYAKKQKLRGEQDVQTVREGKLFVLLLALQNDVGNIIVAAPSFTVSPELKTNIQSYALAVLLSPKLAQYRGDLSVQHVMEILMKHRFDMPPGIENNPADMQKVTSTIQDAFTQCRSSCKKKAFSQFNLLSLLIPWLTLFQLFASVRVTRTNESGQKIIVDLEPSQHQNLFALAQALVDGTKCRITNALCGRISLMRDVFLQNSGTTYWTDLDKALVVMRQIAKGNDEARDAMFEELIITDKELHGAVDIVYQPTNDVQQEVDDLIDASSADAASTPTTASNISPPPEGESDVQPEGESA
ncbi:hypothetical protein B0H10DRAFT_2191214 [Mycena sp. CBHHK59/15]|nr:hypothetical protein B0H10DRAFT_2191214 [Mycena sp. CBHHK59/15]